MNPEEWLEKADELAAKGREAFIHSKPFSVKYKKWWYRFIPAKRKAIRYMDECINRPEVVAEVYDKSQAAMLDLVLFGRSITHVSRTTPPDGHWREPE